jgi:hypothetical protein
LHRKNKRKQDNIKNPKTIKRMSKTFIIGDREKNEWISVFSENEKTMAFCNEMSKAKTFATPNEAKEELEQMQKTGYFTDLSVYLLEDGNAYIAGERDSYQPIV